MNQPQGKSDERRNDKMKKSKEKEKKPRGKGRKPTTINFPTIIPIKITRTLLNFYGFPKFTVMKMRNLRNELSLLNAYMMFCFLWMLC